MSAESTGKAPPRTRGESVRRVQTGLRRLTQGLHRLNDAVGSHVELLAVDLSVLDLIGREGPMSPRDVTDLTGIHPATLTGILDRLEQGGWLARRPDPVDRRRTIVEAISDRGGELVRLYAPMSKAVAALCAEYSPEELAAIVDFMEKAADAGEAATKQLRTGNRSV
jgi:DNA-binding MarR family transcriptional regulator